MKNGNFKHNLVCPACRCRLIDNVSKLICSSCGRHYPIVNGIPDFREKNGYWCNVSREKMQKLNRLAEETGDWRKAAKEIISQSPGHFISFDRADCQFLWPCTKESKILDAGSMWGDITIPAAQFHSEVYAVDKTIETLEFLKIRAEQMGFNNISIVASGLKNLPFPDKSFDLVILSGVLEWVAFEEEIILERQWRGRFRYGLRPEKSIKYSENPKATQRCVLREMQRVLKPGGCLYLAIENRIGYIYLAGYPDGHMDLPFICFMPRPLANAITKWFLKCEYRTYVYTIPGYKSLLQQSGFRYIDFYGAFMHYIEPKEVVPLHLIKNLKEKILSTKGSLKNKAVLKLFPKSLLKWFSPSVIAIAAKDLSRPNSESRLIQLLKKAGLLRSNSGNIKIIKCDSRPGNELTANYWVYDADKNKPKYFCKICRNKEATGILDTEAKNLRIARNLLKETELNHNIPKLLYYGTIDNITFMTTEFLDGKTYPAKPAVIKWKLCLRELDKRIKLAIELLAKFQKLTHIKNVKTEPCLIDTIRAQKEILHRQGELTADLRRSIDRAIEEIREFGDTMVPRCAVHGDYDLCNLLFCDGNITLLDFEHFQVEGFPFFDLANIMFNSLLITYGDLKKGTPISEVISRYKLNQYIFNWLILYSELSGTSMDILKFVGLIAGLEQRTIKYPDYRDPETYPIFKKPIFEDLITWRPRNVSSA